MSLTSDQPKTKAADESSLRSSSSSSSSLRKLLWSRGRSTSEKQSKDNKDNKERKAQENRAEARFAYMAMR